MRWMLSLLFIMPTLTHAQGAEELTLVKQLFAELQPKSIRWNREYCGYIGYDSEGELVATRPAPGKRDACLPYDPTDLALVLSSYHTHGAFLDDFYNEIPSGVDMEGDVEEGIDGWVATPGGRLWYIDTEKMTATQVCGIGCLPMDQTFQSGSMGHVAPSYSYDDLVRRLEEEEVNG